MGARKTSELLEAARKRIEDPQCWTKQAFARDKSGWIIGGGELEIEDLMYLLEFQEGACQWCAVGALAADADDADELVDGLGALNTAISKLYGVSADDDRYRVALINDHGDHEQILKVFDTAIQLAKLGEGASS